MQFSQFQQFSRVVHERADRISRMIVDRARAEAARAGLDPSMPFLHAHNAVVSFDGGRPWPEVDYKLARRVLWLERRSWEPGRLAERIIDRAWKAVVR